MMGQRRVSAFAFLWFAAMAAGGTPASPEGSFQAALKARTAGDWASALASFEEALGLDPDNLRYGSEYRQAVIQTKDHERCLQFFERLVAGHTSAANAYLNYGFAYVDKMPVAGSITQVILANAALAQFSKAIEVSPTWLAYYTRGNSYLFWPKIFGRTPLGIADLEKAMAMQKKDAKKSYHVRVYISLGDGYWKMDDLEKAHATWNEGLREFPGNSALQARLSRSGDQLKAYIDDVFDPSKRVDTNLSEMWAGH